MQNETTAVLQVKWLHCPPHQLVEKQADMQTYPLFALGSNIFCQFAVENDRIQRKAEMPQSRALFKYVGSAWLSTKKQKMIKSVFKQKQMAFYIIKMGAISSIIDTKVQCGFNIHFTMEAIKMLQQMLPILTDLEYKLRNSVGIYEGYCY